MAVFVPLGMHHLGADFNFAVGGEDRGEARLRMAVQPDPYLHHAHPWGFR